MTHTTQYLLTRHLQEEREKETLAPYATHSGESLGRIHSEDEHEYRTAFQRDRDRIIHCVAFRRLEYKTQVFVAGLCDHYRTRLTHTLEVAQIARTLSRILRANEDLCEAIALAHDLGHPPFGHAGERVLNGLIEKEGGFEHNAQALRIVDRLECRYAGFPGLNLTTETRTGILKGHTPYQGMGRELADFRPIEEQIVDIADAISYHTHDLDDGIESGLLTKEKVLMIPLWRESYEATEKKYPNMDDKRKRYRTIVAVINALVEDVIQESARRLDESGNTRFNEAVGYSAPVEEKVKETKAFLFEHLYRHPLVLRTRSRSARIIKHLFEHYTSELRQLPQSFQDRIESDGQIRTVADYIAGMTDRFAEEDYRQLFGF